MSNKKRILIAEDEPAYRELLQTKLSQEGFDVALATNGVEVLTLVQSYKPQLLLLDMRMPKKNGFEVLAEMKDNNMFKEIIIICLSNLGQEEEIQKAKQLGAHDYIIKADEPFLRLIAKIKKLLQSKEVII